mgnify:FL=1
MTRGLRMSEADFAARKQSAPVAKAHRRRVMSQDGMNATEEDYSHVLELRKIAGEISDWKFHAIKLRLAKATFYDTDFMVTLPTGEIEIHEVKGHMEDDAAVKFKVAQTMFPFRFVLAERTKSGWEVREWQK